ncbi:dystrophin-related protein 2-like [Cynoglossus semilaevis]|uniref:dystrophin-related protein 2-like n=1 Tax=Cynoglossus semilaevis TaxID=244447 RepID=UPI000D62DF30|nr:dystrophin-related protein 2-like [Cynoglossus semilaevis]
MSLSSQCLSPVSKCLSDEDQYLLRRSSPALDQDSPCGQHLLLSHLEQQDKEQLQRTLTHLENENSDEDQYLLRRSSPALDQDSPCGQHLLLSHLEQQDKEQLQRTLTHLENENRVLQSEYRRLKWKHDEATSVPMLTEAGERPGSPTVQDEELLAEARVLRQHKTRLETRMQILEDHNKQLESQLRRLRELLLQPKDDSEANGSEPSTLSSPISGGGRHGEPTSRETTDTEAAGLPHAGDSPTHTHTHTHTHTRAVGPFVICPLTSPSNTVLYVDFLTLLRQSSLLAPISILFCDDGTPPPRHEVAYPACL